MTTDIVVRQPQHTFADLERMAKAVAESGLFGTKTVPQALTLMLLAQAEGLHPAIAARDYHIIEGRPSLKADTILARFLGAGGKVDWHALTADKAEATFTAPGATPLRMDWTIEQAKTAGLVRNNRDGSPGTWMKYPRALLRSRLISEGVRTVMPQVIAGIHTPEELTDEPELRDVTPPREAAQAVRQEPDIIDVDTSTGEIHAPQGEAQPAAQSDHLPESALADHLAAIEAAATLADLKKAHAAAYAAAYRLKDGEALVQFAAKKDSVKARLAAKAAA